MPALRLLSGNTVLGKLPDILGVMSTGQSHPHTTCQQTLAHHSQYHLEPCSRLNRMWFAGGQQDDIT
jgi:hypothetical protein